MRGGRRHSAKHARHVNRSPAGAVPPPAFLALRSPPVPAGAAPLAEQACNLLKLLVGPAGAEGHIVLKVDVHVRLPVAGGQVEILSRDEADEEGGARACTAQKTGSGEADG